MPRFADMSNAELSAWITNFTTVVGASPTTFGFTSDQVSEFADGNTSLQSRTTATVALRESTSAAIKAEQIERDYMESRCSLFNTTLKINPDVAENKKIQAGIDPNKPPTHTPPVAPTDLIANGYENGTNVLRWSRADNKTGTQFVIEYREAAQTEFEMLDVTTQTTYTHEGVTPGMQCAYRVKAKRAGESSPYSNIAVVYMT